MCINKRSYLLSVCLAVLAGLMISALWPNLALADEPRADEGLRIAIANEDSAAPSTTTPDPSTPEDSSPT